MGSLLQSLVQKNRYNAHDGNDKSSIVTKVELPSDNRLSVTVVGQENDLLKTKKECKTERNEACLPPFGFFVVCRFESDGTDEDHDSEKCEQQRSNDQVDDTLRAAERALDIRVEKRHL